ncbi:MAG: cytochrome c biogenesis protein CcsA [Flavobacteriaceae bacterium]
MKKFYNILFSTRLTAILFIVFGAAMGIATFIENDYGTQSSKALVYNTWWFELIMVIFVINFIGNIARYRLLRLEKLPVLILHLSFILIILGAAVTRYISYEGLMPIKEGDTTDLMLSERTYLSVTMDDGTEQRGPFEHEYLFTHDVSKGNSFIAYASRFFNFIRGGNDFSFKTDFKGKPVEVNYVNYIPNAFQRFAKDENAADKYLHLVESSGMGRHDHYVKKGEIVNVHNVLVAFDKPTEGAVNIISKNDSLFINTPFAGTNMVMTTQEHMEVKADTIQPFMLRSLYNLGSLQFVAPEIVKGKMVEEQGNKDQFPADMLEVQVVSGVEKRNVKLYGYKYSANPPEQFSLNGLNFRVSYGAKQIQLPFSIKLRDFQLERYPGSMSPKSYASEITVYDNDENFDFRIFMNHVLDHKGYRFFQSSYNDKGPVEESHLSVNHDMVGTWMTYIGYFLLYLGLIWILISKNTRFADLRRMLKKVEEKKQAMVMVLLLVGFSGFSQQTHQHTITKEKIDSILNSQRVSDEHAKHFGSLVIQDQGGRMKPLNTFTSELLRKVSKKDHYEGLDANQVAVSLVTNPRMWFNVPFIYINPNNTKLRDLIGIPHDQKYARLSDMFSDRGEYILREEVSKAHKKKIKNKYEESILNVDGRANILYQAIAGSIYKFFPLQGDENNKWHSYLELRTAGFKGTDSLFVANIIPLYAGALTKAQTSNDYKEADEYLESIHKYQHKFGSEVMPTDKKIQLELFYNKYDIFKGLFWQYMLAAVALLFLVVADIIFRSKLVKVLIKISTVIVLLLFVYQTIGLGIRWYISGHAPWSNAYEAMIYVSWATMLFGLILGKKSPLTIGAAAFVVSMLLMIAHWNWMDPSIGNLVPVLDSYWLMIHVAIIVGSYGPFTLGMVLSMLSLLLYALTTSKNKPRMDLAIKEITVINEMALTIGLVMLTIGNFLGGMWANESWGRYWGWDPKETWALVSIMVYAFVIHMRLVPGLRGRLAFNIISVFAFASILMTFLGVNHLLSGLHSYAVGESAPVPNQIWGWLFISLILSILAYYKYKKFYKKES